MRHNENKRITLIHVSRLIPRYIFRNGDEVIYGNMMEEELFRIINSIMRLRSGSFFIITNGKSLLKQNLN